jgi:carnitine 3-dehydrogenase
MDINKIACIGAGLIGQGWATEFSSKGFNVILQDIDEAVLDAALKRIRENLRLMEENSFLEKGEAKNALERIKTTTRIDDAVRAADYVQESVPDTYDVKKRIFKEMDAAAPGHSILASSASGLVMTEIQKVTTKPGRCVLAHPMLPVHLLPVVEIVGGEQTSLETVKTTRAFMKAAGKIPIVLNKEVPGYIVNRLQAALLREAIDLVDKGIASAEDVDRAFSMGVGLRDPIVGPLFRIHLAGNGIEGFFENYSQSYSYRWETMESWTAIPVSAKNAVIKGVNEMEAVRTKSLEEIKSWRVEMLAKILIVVREGSMK